jgi:ABC-type branched-subunit amino acid transport system ATPase component
MLLQADEISVRFGGVRAVSGVSAGCAAGEILGIIGPNGSGKTTFLNALTGVVDATGRLTVDGKAVTLGNPARSYDAGLLRVFQAPQMFPSFTVLENVLIASRDRAWSGFAGSWGWRPGMWRHERRRWERAHRSLERVGLGDAHDQQAAGLPYGSQRLVEMARAINAEPAVLMLDEPSAGLNDAETANLATLVESLRADGLAILLVDHKIDVIDQLCDRVMVLEQGQTIAEGRPADVWADARVMDAYLGTVGDA